MDKLNQFRNEYYKVDATMAEPQRTLQLSEIMSCMESEFNIKILNDKEYNENNVAVMALYKEISTARNI